MSGPEEVSVLLPETAHGDTKPVGRTLPNEWHATKNGFGSRFVSPTPFCIVFLWWRIFDGNILPDVHSNISTPASMPVDQGQGPRNKTAKISGQSPASI